MMVKEKHYAGFVDKYTLPMEIGLSGLDCYRLRGGLIHRGNVAGHPKFQQSHVIFTTPESGIHIHGLTMKAHQKEAIMFDLTIFCEAMIQAALRWYADHQTHPKVIENLPHLLSWRPFGMPPFVGGTPVIASEA
jgi:hypothetical protein